MAGCGRNFCKRDWGKYPRTGPHHGIGVRRKFCRGGGASPKHPPSSEDKKGPPHACRKKERKGPHLVKNNQKKSKKSYSCLHCSRPAVPQSEIKLPPLRKRPYREKKAPHTKKKPPPSQKGEKGQLPHADNFYIIIPWGGGGTNVYIYYIRLPKVARPLPAGAHI